MRRLLCLAALAALAAVPADAAGPAAVACPVPSEVLDSDARLPATAAHLRRKEPLTIVAIGGASTAGAASGDGSLYGYPRQLEDALRRRHPGMAITVVNAGVPRETAADMVARFARDVVPQHPTLVLWETGTVDAVGGTDVDGFADTLQDGIDLLRQHHFDVMLIDMQYNPGIGSLIDFGPYLEAMRNAAELEDVSLFPRYDVMRKWSDNGIFELVDVPQARRTGLAREVYRCLGAALAEAIDHEAK